MKFNREEMLKRQFDLAAEMLQESNLECKDCPILEYCRESNDNECRETWYSWLLQNYDGEKGE